MKLCCLACLLLSRERVQRDQGEEQRTGCSLTMTKTLTAWALSLGWFSRGASPASRRKGNICLAPGAISKILFFPDKMATGSVYACDN